MSISWTSCRPRPERSACWTEVIWITLEWDFSLKRAHFSSSEQSRACSIAFASVVPWIAPLACAAINLSTYARFVRARIIPTCCVGVLYAAPDHEHTLVFLTPTSRWRLSRLHRSTSLVGKLNCSFA